MGEWVHLQNNEPLLKSCMKLSLDVFYQNVVLIRPNNQ